MYRETDHSIAKSMVNETVALVKRGLFEDVRSLVTLLQGLRDASGFHGELLCRISLRLPIQIPPGRCE